MKKNIFLPQIKFSKGLTLIEILVTTLIFSIVVGAVLASFISALNSQKRILAYQELFDTTSYIIEYKTRYLRMAKKDMSSTSTCVYPYVQRLGVIYTSCDSGIQGSCIRFINPLGKNCMEFYQRENKLINWIDQRGDFDLTSTTTVEITSLKFLIQGEDGEDLQQPRVTFPFIVKLPRIDQKIRLQTTISPRIFDVEPN